MISPETKKLLEADGYIVQSSDDEISISDSAKPKYKRWILLMIVGFSILPLMRLDTTIIFASAAFVLYSIYELIKEKKTVHNLIINKTERKVRLKFKFDKQWTTLDFNDIEGIETSELDVYNEPNPFSNKNKVKYCKIKLKKESGQRINLLSQKLNSETRPLVNGLVSDLYSYF